MNCIDFIIATITWDCCFCCRYCETEPMEFHDVGPSEGVSPYITSGSFSYNTGISRVYDIGLGTYSSMDNSEFDTDMDVP